MNINRAGAVFLARAGAAIARAGTALARGRGSSREGPGLLSRGPGQPPAGRSRAHLSLCVARVPQGVPQVLTRARGGVHHLEGHPRVAVGPGGLVLPVGLRHLLPHHHVEAAAGLVAEDKARVVVVTDRVHVERAAEVDRPELVET